MLIAVFWERLPGKVVDTIRLRATAGPAWLPIIGLIAGMLAAGHFPPAVLSQSLPLWDGKHGYQVSGW